MKKIEIHYTTLLFLFLSVLAGMFRETIIIYSIIIVHELGHILVSILLKYKFKKIIIYPYGGMIEYNDIINREIKEDLSVALAGIIMQSIYYFIIIILFKYSMIRESSFNIFYKYHFSILFFNLIPIYPLDGAKILNLTFNKIISFKYSHILSIIISIILIIIIMIYNHNNSSVFMICFLLINKVYCEIKNHKYIYNKFLLERYIYNFNFKKKKYIKGNSLKKMFKDYNHIFYYKKNIYTEKEMLNNVYKNK